MKMSCAQWVQTVPKPQWRRGGAGIVIADKTQSMHGLLLPFYLVKGCR